MVLNQRGGGESENPSAQQLPTHRACRCHEVSHGAAGQDLDELEFQKSACFAAMIGDVAKLERILERHPEQIHQDGRQQSGEGVCELHPATSSGYSPLIYASRAGQVEAVKLLLRKGAYVDRQTTEMRSTALHRAAVAGHAEVVRLLLDAGADASIRDCDGMTPLERVASQTVGRGVERRTVVELLTRERMTR